MIITVVRTAVVYFFVTLAIRLMGKRQIGDMQPNELVITLLISEIAAIPLQDSSQPVLNGIVAIFMLVILEIIISVLTMKSPKIRKLMSGNSAVVIKNGIIDQKTLKKVRLTVIDLIELLRGQGYFKIEEIAFAILEVNGSLSVIEKSQYRPLQTGDLKHLKTEKASLPLPVISDGKVMYESLSALNITLLELEQKISPVLPKDIFLMTLDRYGKKEVIMKEKKN
ncbi:MAG: DUF421 domain-containing protein [Acutalibacteraceae bacterium]|nr:DUF421 domain-containing protein [Acutalibacteraceae bacterium]